MNKQVYKIKDAKAVSMIKESLEDKKAIDSYFKTGDKSELVIRNIRFVKPL